MVRSIRGLIETNGAGFLAKTLLLDGIRVLVAEDNAMNWRVLEMTLDSFGVQADHAWDGVEAVDAYKASGGYDIVLMDLMMPNLDGNEATRQIRAYEHSENVKPANIIAVSANALPNHITEAIEAGCDAHVAKPVEPVLLLRAMSKIGDKRKNERKSS